MKEHIEQIQDILNNEYSLNLSKESITNLLEPNAFNNNKNLSYMSWMGDQINDLALGFILRDRDSNNIQSKFLLQSHNIYCTQTHHMTLLNRMGILKYLSKMTNHNKSDFFEAILYHIYEEQGIKEVTNFLMKLNFLHQDDCKTTDLNSDEFTIDTCIEFLSNIKDCKNENPTEVFHYVFTRFENLAYTLCNHYGLANENTNYGYHIELLYEKYGMSKKNINSFQYKILIIYNSLNDLKVLGNYQDLFDEVKMNENYVREYINTYILDFIQKIILSIK